MKPRRTRGVTLLELMIGLAVLAVLGTLALPSMHGRIARERLQAAAEALAGDLADARFEAARRGSPLHVEVQTGPAWCWAVTTTPGCRCGLPQACQLKTVLAADHPGVRLLEAHATGLDTQGIPDGPVGALFDGAQGQPQLRVELHALGRTRICTAKGVSARYPSC